MAAKVSSVLFIHSIMAYTVFAGQIQGGTFEKDLPKLVPSTGIAALYCRSALLRFNVLLRFMTAPLAALLHESSISKEDRKEPDIIMLLYGTRTAVVIYREAYRAGQTSNSLAQIWIHYCKQVR